MARRMDSSKLNVGAVLSATSMVGEGRGTYVLLERHNNHRQWRVLVLEADTAAGESPGETIVINDDWLYMYTKEIGQ